MDTRRATRDDLERLRRLLEESGLPLLPSTLPLANVVVALEGHETIGGIGMEVHGRSGLVRSVVVRSDCRRRGVGSSLARSLVARAYELGLRDLYLLTEAPSGFFDAVGFEKIDRADLPPEIRSVRGFEPFAHEAATAMRLPLETRW